MKDDDDDTADIGYKNKMALSMKERPVWVLTKIYTVKAAEIYCKQFCPTVED